MPNLADNFMREKFVQKLELCESMSHHMTTWEQNFIRDMREKFDSRADAEDLGMNPWNPTSSQWNILSEIIGKIG